MRTLPHFLMIKSDGSVKDISRFNGYSPAITGYPTNPDSNIGGGYRAFMMTKDMKLYGYKWKTGIQLTCMNRRFSRQSKKIKMKTGTNTWSWPKTA